MAGCFWPATERVPILAAAAMGAAFMVSYARAKSEGLGFTPGTGMAAVGLMPREVRLVILVARPDPRPTAPSDITGHRSSPSAIIAVGVDHHRHPADPPSSAPKPSRPADPGPAPSSNGEQHVSKNGNNGNGKNGATPSNTWAGAGRRGDGKIRVAIVGVGNCASSLVQGRYYYENAERRRLRPRA